MIATFRRPALALLLSVSAIGTAVAQTNLRVGLAEDPDILDPSMARTYVGRIVFASICDKLFDIDEKLNIVPQLALGHETSADGKTLTIKLRPGVKFHDGEPMDAAAAKYSLDRHLSWKFSVRKSELSSVDSVEVVDPLTVKFTFTKPSVGFLQGTSVIGSGLVSLKTLAMPFDALGDATKIVGSGPFVVKSEVLGREIVMEARKDYAWGPMKLAHQGRANLDGIKYVVTPEDSVRIGALLAGQANVIRQVQAYDEKQVTSKGFIVYAAPTRGVNNSVVFRPDNPMVADLKVRQALLHATNAREIVTTLFSANYPQAKSIIASTAQGYVDLSAKLAYDPALAAKLLDEAGWKMGPRGVRQKDGKDFVMTTYESLPQPQNKETLQLVAQQWAKVGVKLSVLAGDAGSRTLDMLDPAKTPVAPAMVGRADPDVIRSQYYPTTRNVLMQKGGVSNKVQTFVDDKLNALLEAIAAETDVAKRMALVGEVQTYVIDQAYTIPIFEEPQAFAASPRVKEFAFEAVGRPSFYTTWIAPK